MGKCHCVSGCSDEDKDSIEELQDTVIAELAEIIAEGTMVGMETSLEIVANVGEPS